MPSTAVLLGAWLAVAAPAFAFAGRRWTFGRLLVVQGCGQLVLHPLFDASASSPAAESTLMTVAHLVATLVLAGVLAWGDRVLWRLAAAVAALAKPLRAHHALVVLPVRAASRLPVTAFTRLPAPLGVTRSPAAERAPPVSRSRSPRAGWPR